MHAEILETGDGKKIMIRIPGTVDYIIDLWEADALRKELSTLLESLTVWPDHKNG